MLLHLSLLALPQDYLCQCWVPMQGVEEASQGMLRVGCCLPLEVILRNELAEGHTQGEFAVELVQDFHWKWTAGGGPMLPVGRMTIQVGS